ncbi:MAG: hypothetical protein OK438_01430 [Thaumarchaeota archaeon]|nr:hypothetical protein [Nitrososphaerota archaeon]
MAKSIKLYWNERTLNSGDALGLLFGDRKETLKAAKLVISRMKEANTLSMTKRELRFFAKELQTGKLGVKYSYHNFYTKLLRKLLDLGFVEKDVLIWDQKRRKTVAVYQLKIQSIPERAPSGGFVRHAWQVAKGWNDLVQS